MRCCISQEPHSNMVHANNVTHIIILFICSFLLITLCGLTRVGFAGQIPGTGSVGGYPHCLYFDWGTLDSIFKPHSLGRKGTKVSLQLLKGLLSNWILGPSCTMRCAVLNVSDSLQLHGSVAYQTLCPCGFSKQEYWTGLLQALQGIYNPGLNPGPALQADSFTICFTQEALITLEGYPSPGIFLAQELNQWDLLHCR